MHDPTRIPQLIAALQEAWEGQPDLSFAQLVGVLENRGLRWGTSDTELLEMLGELSSEHPSLIDATSGPLSITTIGPDQLVTVAAPYVVVRSAIDGARMPAVWRFAQMRRTGPGLPLVLTDEGGVEHHLGVVSLVARVGAEGAPSIRGMRRRDIGNARWLVQFADGRRTVVGQRIRVWETVGREVRSRWVAWETILGCEPGEDMQIAPAGGGEPLSLGRVELVLLLEA